MLVLMYGNCLFCSTDNVFCLINETIKQNPPKNKITKNTNTGARRTVSDKTDRLVSHNHSTTTRNQIRESRASHHQSTSSRPKKPTNPMCSREALNSQNLRSSPSVYIGYKIHAFHVFSSRSRHQKKIHLQFLW